MSKPYTADDFSRQVTEDRTWRIREISDLKNAVLRADEALQKALLRALVTITYAHWEGYVRFSARKYFEHIALRRIRFDKLNRQFLRNYFLPRLSAIAVSGSSLSARCELVDAILTSGDKAFTRANDELVNTKANLNFGIFSDICLVCGLDNDNFLSYESYIDVFLLKRRNSIAHGEDTFIAIDDLDELSQKTIELMRMFGDGLDNRIALEAYKAA
ncbi:MAE_28990/MAE_18760 family HEPN-like nuclease [Asticcacaulis sp. 201]|uniref:MAE_28990/MAE_18760 family HEPN-like nuclease n=1 Tax=Asticcacaulis sp. 201 TaxID=3028787 RepID=UPI0029160202|nr:MAE_28990/MAE_18760 family HEPN-like nuclease [Asticcacaulis sp. 201]MDV6330118.1 MAE_28990/MAE_18760 family HEPN-like nuclease [Asticcacaulis sp. 201]